MPDNQLLKQLLQHGFRYAYSLTHNKAQAEDFVQDAWLSMMKHRNPQTKAYFYTVIRNKFLNQLKHEKIVPLISVETTKTEESLTSTEEELSNILADKDMIDKALAHIKPLEREIIYLYYFEEYSTVEISELTDLSKGMVCSLIHRTRLKLKEHIHSLEKKVLP